MFNIDFVNRVDRKADNLNELARMTEATSSLADLYIYIYILYILTSDERPFFEAFSIFFR
jgi:hypothetical protein